MHTQSGESVTLGQTPHHAPIYRVGAYAVKEENGQVSISKGAKTGSPSLKLGDKVKIRLHKVTSALGCGCVSGSGIPRDDAAWDGSMWSVTSCSKISHDCLIIRLASKGVGGAEHLTAQHLWHISLRLEVQGEMVERDYTPISSLADYKRGSITLWIRVYPDGKLTSALERVLMPMLAAGESAAAPPPSAITLSIPPPALTDVTGQRSLAVSKPAETLLLAPPPSSALLLVSGGTGLAPILQALNVALALPARPGVCFTSVVLVHSARSVRDVALLNQIASALASGSSFWRSLCVCVCVCVCVCMCARACACVRVLRVCVVIEASMWDRRRSYSDHRTHRYYR